MREFYAMPQRGQSDLEDTIRQLVTVLQDSRRALDQQFTDLKGEYAKQADRLEALRKELPTLYVSRVEYDPKHTVILDRIKEYDQIIKDSQKTREEFIQLKSKVESHEDELEDLEDKMTSGPARIIQYISIAISIVTFLITLLHNIKL